MYRRKHAKHSSTMTAVGAVILLLMGLTTICASLWMQERQVERGAEEYGALAEQLKRPQTVPSTQSTAILPAQTNNPIPLDAAIKEQPPLHQVIEPTIPLREVTSNVPETAPPHPTAEPTDNAYTNVTGADLAACQAVNSDFVGWLSIPGTKVDYPVVQSSDAAYYLHHTFNRKESVVGCLFSLDKTDYQAPSRNIAVYGHHMRRSRTTTMFQTLHEYKNASFYNDHAAIDYDTLYGFRRYTVFAVINKRESDWDASAADFASEEEFQAFIDRALAWSLYDTGVQVSADDHILTLITCDRDYHAGDGQLVVMAVQNEPQS